MTDIVKKYLSALLSFLEASANSNNILAQKQYKIMNSNFRKLRDSEKLVELTELLENESESVRLWVSTHLLVFDEDLAKSSLNTISKGNSMAAFSAEITLQEWNEGNLTYLIK